MTDANEMRGPLALVHDAAADSVERIAFCSHCGTRPQPDTHSRVCENCGFGVLLETRQDAAPSAGDAFLVIDDSMSVCAVSAAAERLLAVDETDAVNSHLTELLVPADAEGTGRTNLAVAITWAARGSIASRKVVVRPAHTFGLRLPARIVSCGPPKAALIVFE